MQDGFPAEDDIQSSFKLSDIVFDIFRKDFEEIEIHIFSFIHQLRLQYRYPRLEIRRFDIGDKSQSET